jgi:curli biogenesis system outer membrane secretion channel CsgG
MSASVDRSQAKASEGVPEVAEIDPIQIPYDGNYPVYVVAVEPLSYGATDVISGQGPQEAPSANSGLLGGGGVGSMHSSPDAHDRTIDSMKMSGSQVGRGMAAQLLTALANSGNISVIEYSALQKNADGSLSCALEEGEIGPFIVRGIVTEFNETADLSEQKKGGSLGRAGIFAGIIGAVTGKDALTVAGAGVAAANPTMEKGDVKRKGMVALDLRIVNGKNSRIVGAFKSSGTFVSVSSVSGFSLFGIGAGGSEFAASALGQATRAAMNDAVQKTTVSLKNKAPKK